MRKIDKNTQDIDFVITWVDGNDLEWKREKAARLGHTDMDISVSSDTVTFTTQGSGHRVGLSQYGADGMARRGYTYKEILRHYYSGADIEKAA